MACGAPSTPARAHRSLAAAARRRAAASVPPPPAAMACSALYRQSKLGQALVDALDQLIEEHKLPPQLALRVLDEVRGRPPPPPPLVSRGAPCRSLTAAPPPTSAQYDEVVLDSLENQVTAKAVLKARRAIGGQLGGARRRRRRRHATPLPAPAVCSWPPCTRNPRPQGHLDIYRFCDNVRGWGEAAAGCWLTLGRGGDASGGAAPQHPRLTPPSLPPAPNRCGPSFCPTPTSA